MNPQPPSAGNVHLYLYINPLLHGLPQLVVYIFIYTFSHRHPVFFFCISFFVFLFLYAFSLILLSMAVDCWGTPWTLCCGIFSFFTIIFLPLALEFSAVDRLLWIALDFSAVDFPFLSRSFFIRFFSPLSLSSFILGIPLCCGDFPLFPWIFSFKAAGLIHGTDILHSRPRRTIGMSLRSKGFSPQPSTAEL